MHYDFLEHFPFLDNISWSDYRDKVHVVKLQNYLLDDSNLFTTKTERKVIWNLSKLGKGKESSCFNWQNSIR